MLSCLPHPPPPPPRKESCYPRMQGTTAFSPDCLLPWVLSSAHRQAGFHCSDFPMQSRTLLSHQAITHSLLFSLPSWRTWWVIIVCSMLYSSTKEGWGQASCCLPAARTWTRASFALTLTADPGLWWLVIRSWVTLLFPNQLEGPFVVNNILMACITIRLPTWFFKTIIPPSSLPSFSHLLSPVLSSFLFSLHLSLSLPLSIMYSM